MTDFYCEQVLSGLTPVEVVFETSGVLAFKHTRPFWETHIVVVPKRHVESLLELEDLSLLEDIMFVIKRVAALVTEEFGAARVLTNLGRYQESKHLHFHINSGMQIKPDNPV